MTYEIGDTVLLARIDEESLEEHDIGYLSGMDDYVDQHATLIQIEDTSTGHTAFLLEFEDGVEIWFSEPCLGPIRPITNLKKFFDI